MRYIGRFVVLCLMSLVSHVCLACSCMAYGPACTIEMGSSPIFRGTVVERTLIPNIKTFTRPDGSTQQLMGNGRFRVRFSVAETFSGKPQAEQVVYTNEQGSMCGFPFQEGREYVVFGSMHEGEIWTSHCSRTAMLEPGGDNEDIRWMRSRATAPPGSEILGKALLPVDTPRRAVPATIHLSGPTEMFVQTSPDGQYTAAGLQPGEYMVSASVPAGFSVSPSSLKVTVQDKGCAQMDWYVTYDGTVSGHVRDANGKPVADLRMFLETKAAPPSGYTHNVTATTQLDGTYRFDHLSPGQYLLYTRDAAFLTEDDRAPIYFPHTDRAGATPIELGESATLGNYNFTLGKLKPVLPVRVTVLEPDGSPAHPGLMLFAFPNGTYGGEPTRTGITEASGLAILPLQSGRQYAISVALDGHHQNCGFLTQTFSEIANSGTVTITAPDKCRR